MQKKQKQELIRVVLYSMSSLIVGCAVGAALLMKVVTEGDTRRARQNAKAAQQQDVQTEAPAVTLPAAEVLPAEPEPEPVIAVPPPPDAESLRILLRPAEPLLSVSYSYTDSDCYETHSEVWGKKVPFTTDTVILTCDGTICMGIEADAILYTVDPEAMRITVTLPEPEVLSHDLDEDSIRYYDIRNSIFRSPTLEDYTALLREMKENIREKAVEERQLGVQTLDNAETVLRGYLSVIEATKDYAVSFIRPEPEIPAPAAADALPEDEPAETVPAETETELPFFTESEPEDYGRNPDPEIPLFPFWW